MGSLFSRARGGSEATDGDTDLFSEVKAATRVASTPGTPRAALGPCLPMCRPWLSSLSHPHPARVSLTLAGPRAGILTFYDVCAPCATLITRAGAHSRPVPQVPRCRRMYHE